MNTPERPERPDLTGWRRRQQLRRSNAAQPIASAKSYRRKPKHLREREVRDAWR
ncbi:hypothetical protein HGA13_04320 [Nocardia speluncae]|uniref:Uncharacterized protein n=1 Tax=Nocardia speluncae TaxID=419477 RepID=A0A846X8J5_9NOCA|nr:hypothetical protein [Nocardia speluncae]NKY32298.1 hypothetical protein [Nocardia speluncae]